VSAEPFIIIAGLLGIADGFFIGRAVYRCRPSKHKERPIVVNVTVTPNEMIDVDELTKKIGAKLATISIPFAGIKL
jgi:hypothetical protein